MKKIDELYIELQDEEWALEEINHDRIIVRAIVYDDEYFYFLRLNRDDDFGKAELIETSGGGIEKDEDLIDALKRELKEELGVDVKVITKIGIVSDYYNLINRHNINHYYLCKIKSFGNKHLTYQELNNFHLQTLKIKPKDAIDEYLKCADSKLGVLIRNRELPILKFAIKYLELINNKSS